METAETDRVANFATPPSNDEIIEAAGFAHPPAANFAATSERAQPDIVSDAACAATTQSSTEDVISAAPEDELSPLWDDCVSTGVDTLAKLSADGAQFCRVYGRRAKVDHPGKQPFGDGPNGSGWKTPAALDVVAEHMRTGGNAGVLTGDNIKAADGDDRFASWMAHCRRNGRAMTKLIVRRDAWPRRGKALVKISDPDNLKGERFKLSPDPDASPVFEILSDGNAVVAGIHKSGATIEMHDLGEWVEMTAVEFRALVVAWLDSEYPADQYPDATWRALQSSLSASTPSQVRAARPRASVGMLDFAHIDAVPYEQQVRAAIQWFNDDPANVAAAQRLIDGARRKGKYFALRTNDTTPSTCAISDDAYRDFGDDGESRGVRDVFDIIAILDGRNKSRLIFENVNAWRKAHGAQPIPDKYAQPDSARSASAADGAR